MESSQEEKEIYNNVAGTIKLEWKQKLMEVVERMERKRMTEDITDQFRSGYNKAIDQAISLIKKAIEDEKPSYINPNWVSDCCGALMLQDFDGFLFCTHCGKKCNPKQLHDVQINKI